jgi:hypothetical protein
MPGLGVRCCSACAVADQLLLLLLLLPLSGLLQHMPGLGVRALRYSMLVDDGKVTVLNVEEPGGWFALCVQMLALVEECVNHHCLCVLLCLVTVGELQTAANSCEHGVLNVEEPGGSWWAVVNCACGCM